MLTANIKNNEIQWQDLVGKEITNINTVVVCSAFEDNKLYINEWTDNKLTGCTSVISTIDVNRCLSHLKIFGYDIEFYEIFAYSPITIQKSQGLMQAGFFKLIKVDNNYMIDNIFQQNILLEEELQYLLSNNISEINLSEIK